MRVALYSKQELYERFTDLVEDLSLAGSNMNLMGTQAALNGANKYINQKINDLHQISLPVFKDLSVGEFKSSYSRYFRPVSNRYASYQACDYAPGLMYFVNDIDKASENDERSFVNLSKDSEYSDIAQQLGSLLVTLDRLIQFRVGLSDKSLKRDGLSKKLDDSVVECSKTIYEDSLNKLIEVIATLTEPLSDLTKKVLYKEIQTNKELTNVHKYLTQKIPRTTVAKLAPLLGLNPKIHKPEKLLPVKKNCNGHLPNFYAVRDINSKEEDGIFLLKMRGTDLKNSVRLRMVGLMERDGTARFEPLEDSYKEYVRELNVSAGKKFMGSKIQLPVLAQG